MVQKAKILSFPDDAFIHSFRAKTQGRSGHFRQQKATFTQHMMRNTTYKRTDSWDKQKFGEGAATKAWRAVLSGGVFPDAKSDVKLRQIYVHTDFKSEGFSIQIKPNLSASSFNQGAP